MNFAEMQTWFDRHMGKEANSISPTDRATYLNQVNDDIAIRLKIIPAVHSTSTVAQTAEYSLPTDFVPGSIRQVVLDNWRIKGRSWGFKHLPYLPTYGKPYYYYVTSEKIGFWPIPSSVYNFEILYSKRPDVMSQGTDVSQLPSWLHPLVPLGAAAMALINNESPLAEAKVASFEASMIDAERRIARENIDQITVVGREATDYPYPPFRLRYPWE